jgi:hypothetical protein
MHSQNLRNSKSVVRTAVRRISGLGLGLVAAALVACGTEDPAPAKTTPAASSAPVGSTPVSVSPVASAAPKGNDALWEVAWPVLVEKCMLCHLNGLASEMKASIPSSDKTLARPAWELNAVKSKSQVATDVMPPGGGLTVAQKKAIDDWAASVK